MASINLFEHSVGEVPRKFHDLYRLDTESGEYRLPGRWPPRVRTRP